MCWVCDKRSEIEHITSSGSFSYTKIQGTRDTFRSCRHKSKAVKAIPGHRHNRRSSPRSPPLRAHTRRRTTHPSSGHRHLSSTPITQSNNSHGHPTMKYSRRNIGGQGTGSQVSPECCHRMTLHSTHTAQKLKFWRLPRFTGGTLDSCQGLLCYTLDVFVTLLSQMIDRSTFSQRWTSQITPVKLPKLASLFRSTRDELDG